MNYKKLTISTFVLVVLVAVFYYAVDIGFKREKQTVKMESVEKIERTVYVCSGKYARKYHLDRECAGLDNCKNEIVVMPESQAKNVDGKTPCSLCAY